MGISSENLDGYGNDVGRNMGIAMGMGMPL